MPETAKLLDDAVFEDENILEFERWVVMAVGVERDDRKADFFGKNADGLILLLRLLLGVGIGNSDCYEEKSKCVSRTGHDFTDRTQIYEIREMRRVTSWFSGTNSVFVPGPARP